MRRRLPLGCIGSTLGPLERATARGLLLLCVCAGLWAGCAGWPGQPWRRADPGPTPLLWRAVAPAGDLFFLFGSIHVGTSRGRDLGPDLPTAFAAADELVVEVDLSALDPGELRSLSERYGRLPSSSSLRERVSPETFAMVRDYEAARGILPGELDAFTPWFVSLLVAELEYRRMGLAPELGVDRVLIARAEGRMPIVGLESADLQLALLEQLPEPVQELLLRDALARVDALPAQTRQLFDAWESGDEERLTEIVFGSLDELPELEVFYDVYFFQRNEAMADRLAALAGDGRTRLVVVGAGHMVGERGIPRLLEERGFEVERIEPGGLASACAGRPDGPASIPARDAQPARACSRWKKLSSSSLDPAAMPASISVLAWL